MTSTTSITKIAIVAASLAMFASLSFAVAPAHAQSVTFNVDLTIGSTGADVTALQTWLISKGYSIPAGATGYFGAQTQAAVAAYQAKVGITPAAGYFGPITRASVNSMGGGTTGGTFPAGCTSNVGYSTTTGLSCASTSTLPAGCTSTVGYSPTTGVKCSTTGTTPTTPGGLSGGEGSLDVNGNLGDVETDVDEGDEDVQVLGVELEAQDSDIALERVDVDITVGSGGSSQLDNYITEVTLWLDGTKLATLDVDEGDEDSDVYSFRFSGLNGVIDEDDTAELYFAVTAVSNVDSGDSDVNLSIDIPADGIRAVDAAGISETYVTAGEVDAETFSVGEETAGDLDLSEGDTNPDSMVVQIDEDEDTDDVLLLAFDIEANNQDVLIDAIPVGLTSTVDNVSGMASRVILTMDGEVIDTVSVTGSATFFQALFDDLDIDLQDGDTASFEVLADLNDADVDTFATGTTLYATTTASNAAWDVEDANGDNVTPDGGTVTGGTLTFETDGINVEWVSESAVTTVVDGSDNDYATFTMKVDVTAFEEDVFISTAGATAYTYQIEDASTGTVISTSTATTTVISSSADTSGSSYQVNAGTTEDFTFTVTINPLTTDEGKSLRFQLLTVVFGSTAGTPTGNSWSALPAPDYETTGTLVND